MSNYSFNLSLTFRCAKGLFYQSFKAESPTGEVNDVSESQGNALIMLQAFVVLDGCFCVSVFAMLRALLCIGTCMKVPT